MVHFTGACFKENMKSNGKKKVVCISKIILSTDVSGSFPITELSSSSRTGHMCILDPAILLNDTSISSLTLKSLIKLLQITCTSLQSGHTVHHITESELVKVVIDLQTIIFFIFLSDLNAGWKTTDEVLFHTGMCHWD